MPFAALRSVNRLGPFAWENLVAVGFKLLFPTSRRTMVDAKVPSDF
jgi:hypothetical protein